MIASAPSIVSSPEILVLGTSALLFTIGTIGLLMRRSPIALLMSIEILLNAGNLLIVLGARVRNMIDGNSAALLVLVLGAAEAVIGLALALAWFRPRPSADIDSQGEVQG